MRKAWHQNFKRAPAAQRTHNGIVFHSIQEMERWQDLLVMRAAGKISRLTRQIKFPLVLPSGTPIRTPAGRIMAYVADFCYWEDGEEVIVDVKGSNADKFSLLKIAIFEAIYEKKVKIHGIKPKKKKIKISKKVVDTIK